MAAVPTPYNDPNWAYNTQAWTNQGNTGDTESPAVGNSAAVGLLGPNEPIMNNMLAENFDPAQASGVALVVIPTTTVILTKLYLPMPMYVSNVNVFCGVSTTNTFLVGGLYNAAGVLLATSANSISGLTNATIQSMALTTKQSLSAGFVWAAVGAVGTATFSCLTYNAALANVGLLAPSAVTSAGFPINMSTAPRWMTGATGFATTLPTQLTASQFGAVTTAAAWVGLS